MEQTTIYDFLPPDPSFVEQIYTFNKSAGLLDKPYSDFLESSFQIEEALEGFQYIDKLYYALNPQHELSNKQARDTARLITSIAKSGGENCAESDYISDVDRLDKACDAVVFAFGSMFKLGLTPEQAARAVSVVMSANQAKLSMPKDAHGKLTKPAGFVGPEVLLQQILDERN